jgi:DNA-binding transcriptional LysR family regulator
MRKPKLNQLEMLVAVADAGSFGAAAAELGCTQSRISHAITELEDSLAMRLLVRSRTGCVPTDAGHGVLAKARLILRLTGSLVDVAQDNAAVIGRVSIACFRSVGTHLLPRTLEALAVEYPGIRVDVDDSCEEREEVTQAVEEGRADIGVAHLPVGPDLVTRPYVADSYVLVTPASLTLRAPVTWEQFSNVPYIQLNCSGALAILEQFRAHWRPTPASRPWSGKASDTPSCLVWQSFLRRMASESPICRFLRNASLHWWHWQTTLA